MTHLLTVEKRKRKPRRKTTRILPTDKLLAPLNKGKTFKETYKRGMRQEEGLRYLDQKFVKDRTICPNWELEAEYCGVDRKTIYAWRKELFANIRIEPKEVSTKAEQALRHAMDVAMDAMTTEIPKNADVVVMGSIKKLRLDAVRALSQVCTDYTKWAEAWGLKHKEMVPAIDAPQQQAADLDDLDKLSEELLAKYRQGQGGKSKKPEGV